MGKKHFYITFGDDVPKEIEQAYNKIVRREEYNLEKDALGNALLFSNEEELYKENIADYILRRGSESERNEEQVKMIELLHKALERLKVDYPLEYELIQQYYFSDDKVTQVEIGTKRNTTKQAVYKNLKRAYKHLKEYINSYMSKKWIFVQAYKVFDWGK